LLHLFAPLPAVSSIQRALPFWNCTDPAFESMFS